MLYPNPCYNEVWYKEICSMHCDILTINLSSLNILQSRNQTPFIVIGTITTKNVGFVLAEMF